MQCSSMSVNEPDTTNTILGPGCVCQPVDWPGAKWPCCNTPFVPCAWLIALVKASTERTFRGVLPASVPTGTIAGGTLVAGRTAYTPMAPTPSAVTAKQMRVFLTLFLITV